MASSQAQWFWGYQSLWETFGGPRLKKEEAAPRGSWWLFGWCRCQGLWFSPPWRSLRLFQLHHTRRPLRGRNSDPEPSKHAEEPRVTMQWGGAHFEPPLSWPQLPTRLDHRRFLLGVDWGDHWQQAGSLGREEAPGRPTGVQGGGPPRIRGEERDFRGVLQSCRGRAWWISFHQEAWTLHACSPSLKAPWTFFSVASACFFTSHNGLSSRLPSRRLDFMPHVQASPNVHPRPGSFFCWHVFGRPEQPQGAQDASASRSGVCAAWDLSPIHVCRLGIPDPDIGLRLWRFGPQRSYSEIWSWWRSCPWTLEDR